MKVNSVICFVSDNMLESPTPMQIHLRLQDDSLAKIHFYFVIVVQYLIFNEHLSVL